MTDLDQGGRIPQTVRTYLGPTTGWKLTDAPINFNFVIDGGGQLPSNGYKGQILSPDWCVIYSWILLSQTQGSCVIDVWKTTLDDYLAGTPPTVANSITGSDLPTLTNAYAAQSTALTGWTKQINQNDVIGFNLDSASVLTNVTIILQGVRIIGPS